MNIEEVPPECFECEAYVRLLSNERGWTCIVCSMSESVIDLGEEKNHVWHRFELECGHQAHPRCYRQWCARTKTVGCSFCGTRSKENAPRYCSPCDSFGCFKGSHK